MTSDLVVEEEKVMLSELVVEETMESVPPVVVEEKEESLQAVTTTEEKVETATKTTDETITATSVIDDVVINGEEQPRKKHIPFNVIMLKQDQKRRRFLALKRVKKKRNFFKE